MLTVHVVDRESVVWSGEATHINVPAYGGQMGILPGHTPLMALLLPGHLEVETPEESFTFDVQKGFVTVSEDEIYVVVESSVAG